MKNKTISDLSKKELISAFLNFVDYLEIDSEFVCSVCGNTSKGDYFYICDGCAKYIVKE
jgi:hypothetical protein